MQFKSKAEEKADFPVGERDIRSVFMLLAVQCMIQLGEFPDPITNESHVNLKGARLYHGLLEVLQEKTRGNLDEAEDRFLQDIVGNLSRIFKKKG